MLPVLDSLSAAIPLELSILVPFSCSQPFGTCKLDIPPSMSLVFQSSRCFLEKLDVYWQHWFLHEAQQALRWSPASGREAELLLMSNNLDVWNIYPGSWRLRFFFPSAKGSSSSDLQPPTGAQGRNTLLVFCQNWCGREGQCQRGWKTVRHNWVVLSLCLGSTGFRLPSCTAR